MAVSKFLAIDLGASSGRVIVGILENGKISLEEVHRFPNGQVHLFNSSYWNVFSLFEEIKKGLALASEKGHSDIESIGIDTWGVDFGLIGKNGQLLEMPHTYRDLRTDGITEKVFEKISNDEVYGITGIQLMQINSLYQLYSLKLHNQPLLDLCDKLLFMPDIFSYFLTGEKKSEYTIASTSQMLNTKTKTFDEKIFSTLGLSQSICAPIVMPGTVIGKLLPEIAKETGLKEIDVVAVGCHDTASAVAAVPAVGNNWAYLSSGTWSLIGIETEEPVIDLSLQNSFTNEGGVGGKIRFLNNTMGLWFIQEIKKSWERNGENLSFDEITKSASLAKEFVAVIDPDDKLFMNPPDMVEAIKEFCLKTNQDKPQTKGEFARVVLESLALKYKTILEKIEKLSNKKIEKLHIVGGGTQNELLNQLTANATGKQVAAGPIEATALGNIMVQAIAKGKIESLQKGREIIAKSFPVKIFEPRISNK